MARALILVLDSVGCGGAPDAAQFGDEGSNTLGHIADACANGAAEEGRSGPLSVPNLDRLGLGAAVRLASGHSAPGLDARQPRFHKVRIPRRATGKFRAYLFRSIGVTFLKPFRPSPPIKSRNLSGVQAFQEL